MAKKGKSGKIEYDDSDWKNDYYTRHRAEYRRTAQPSEDNALQHPIIPSTKPKLIQFIIDGMDTVSKALKVPKSND